MKLLSPSSRALTRDAITLVSLPHLLRPVLLAALCAVLLAFAGGLWFGRLLAPEPEPAAALPEAALSEAAEQFALSRMGELSGRLQALEADAAQLQRMLVEHQVLTRQLSRLAPSLVPEVAPLLPTASADEGGKGGVWLPPRVCGETAGTAASLSREMARAACLRDVLDQLLERTARRNAALMAIPSRRPVQQARLGSLFGNRLDPFNRRLAFHSGVDFAVPSGTRVYAAAGGKVLSAGRNGGYGQLLVIDHGNGLVTRYAHLARVLVRQGDVVKPEQAVALAGSSGRSTGPHLHFEVLRDGQFVDPQHFLALGDMEREANALAHD